MWIIFCALLGIEPEGGRGQRNAPVWEIVKTDRF